MAVSDQFDYQVLALVNSERAKQNLKPLTLNEKLDTAADRYSKRMANGDFFSHTDRENGSTMVQRVNQTGYRWTTLAENIAVGQPNAEEVVKAWMNSPGHRRNILNPKITHMGLGYFFKNQDGGQIRYRHYWTQVFGAGEPDSSGGTGSSGSSSEGTSGSGSSSEGTSGSGSSSEGTSGSGSSSSGTGSSGSSSGSTGGSEITGTSVSDTLNGLGGNDLLIGLAGNDSLNGGSGNDRLIGGDGKDTLDGGLGADRFIFDKIGKGIDRIIQYNRLEGDRIQVKASGFGINSGNLNKFSFANNTLSFDGKPFAELEEVIGSIRITVDFS